jgi:Holliday junction resolvase
MRRLCAADQGMQVSAFQRRKGQAAERELCRLLSDELGFVVQRNVDQARAGGADCVEVQGFAIECKRQERLCLPAWWRQAVKQGEDKQCEPLVFYRQSRQPWQALIRTVDGGYRVASWEAAVLHVREKIARLYGIYPKEAA